MSNTSATTNLRLNDKEKPSNPSKTLTSTTTEMSNPFETLESLREYEKNPGQSQKFLGKAEIFPEQHTNNTYGSAFTLFLTNFFVDRVGQNFRWPVSMDDCDKYTVFFYLTDSELEYDDESGLNLLFFFDNIDKGTFDEHKDSWVLVYKQEVKKYGTSEYTSKELDDLEDEMPGAIYLPVDKSRRDGLVKSQPARTVCALRTRNEHMVRIQVRRLGTTNSVMLGYNFRDPAENNKLYKSVLDSGAPETILPYHVRRIFGRRGWKTVLGVTIGYGAPARLVHASTTFEVAIGDDNSWTKWVSIDTLRVWENDPGNQVDSALVGNDVLDQLAFVHEVVQGYKFLKVSNEVALTNFIANLS
ncbi:21309_t:CDS:2 [Entrophospora sp. SA101]|nr:21309_t:CDS:2 [Entrophospora sp. SA101]